MNRARQEPSSVALAAGLLVAGRYLLSAPLGAGSQGSVWEAVDTRTGSVRALKFVATDERLRVEAEVLLSIQHSSLPQVHDWGASAHGYFLVLDRIAGNVLDASMPLRTRLRALLEVASALAVLHDAGIVHGDVKPSNILVSGERAWLVDLGLSVRTGAAVTSGTLAFMAPEVLAGERGPAADLFALGVTACLVLAGMHPLVEDPAQRHSLLRALAEHAAPRIAALAALPSGTRDAIAILLAPEPERRGSARAWIARLARDASLDLTPVQRANVLGPHVERVVPPPLVGRDRELDAALRALRGALDGRGLGVLLVGPSGAGKQRVLDAVLRALRIEWSARGAVFDVAEQMPTDPERPTVLVKRGATPEELRALAAELQRIARYASQKSPVVLLATSTVPVEAPGVSEVMLGPIEHEALGALLASLAGHTLESEAISCWARASAGLPGAVVRVALAAEPGAVLEPKEAELQEAFRSKLEQVLPDSSSPALSSLVRALVLVEQPLPKAFVLSLLGADARVGLQEALRRGLVVEREGLLFAQCRLPSGAATTTVKKSLGAALETQLARSLPERVDLRARAAVLRGATSEALFYEKQAAERAESPAERARWLLQALTHASEEEFAQLAPSAASALLLAGDARRALSVLERCEDTAEVLSLRADALRRSGAMEEAKALAEKLANAKEEGARALAAVVLARDALDHGAAKEALTLVEEHWGQGSIPVMVRARVWETRALAFLQLGNADAAQESLRRIEAATLPPALRARMRCLEGMTAQQLGEHTRARDAYREAWTLARSAGDVHGAATYAVNLGAVLLLCGAPGEADHWIERGARELARGGRMTELARSLANRAALRSFLGDREGALAEASRAEHAARTAGDAVTEGLACTVSAECSLRGTAAAEALEAASQAALRGGAAMLAGDALARAAVYWAREGALDRAKEALEKAVDAPSALRALASLEVALLQDAPSGTLRTLANAVHLAVAREPTPEYELRSLALSVRVAERVGDVQEARRAREAHEAKMRALAVGLSEGATALFFDAHRLPEREERIVAPAVRTSAGDARWRRLAEITRELNAETRLRPLLERVIDAVIELTGAARGFLLLQGLDGVLRVRTARNIGRTDLETGAAMPSRSIAERVARTAEAVLSIDATTDGRFDAFESVHALQLRSVLAVPLVVQGRAVGTLYVDDRFRAGAFGEDAMEVAREFAETAALAIGNARMQALLRRSLRKSERLSRQLRKTVEVQSAELEATRQALSIEAPTRGKYDELVGRGPAMLRTLRLVDRVAPTGMPVLLLGESGTGKELLARAIHANSPRTGKPFVAENCGAIPENLLESTLFGHVRGAFTGAERNRAGLFEVADGGTLFLDEVGEMSPAMQAKLLRVLQDGEVRPVGGERSRKVDVRIISATHRDLQEMVRQGKFREDLYYRLAVLVVPVPPLRSRKEDLPSLIEHFVARNGRPGLAVERAAMARMLAYSWPGNVRQLQNVLARAVVLADDALREEELPPELLGPSVSAPQESLSEGNDLDLKSAIDRLERAYVERALRKFHGNQSRAAKALGLSRFGLQKKLKRLGVRAKDEEE